MKGTRNNLFYKKILTYPKGLSTGLPDMVVPHRYVLISDLFQINWMTVLYLWSKGLKYKVKTPPRRSEDRLVIKQS